MICSKALPPASKQVIGRQISKPEAQMVRNLFPPSIGLIFFFFQKKK